MGRGLLATHADEQDADRPIEVWVVEDDERYAEALGAALGLADGIECARAFDNAEDMLRAVGMSAPDVLLLDLHLPGSGGLEVLPELRRRIPQTAVVILTFSDSADLIFRAFRLGANGYLTKDANLDQILTSIREAARGGSLMPAPVATQVLDFLSSDAPSDQPSLTGREKDVLTLMSDGLTKATIAERLCVSRHTVDYHIRSVYDKLHAQSGVEAVAKAIRRGLI
jgi:DNA-binding NarL/FixJ family response regulator